MVDIIHRVGIRAPIPEVYDAVATVRGVAGWWSEETTGESERGGRIGIRFRTPAGEVKGHMAMRVTTLMPEREVRWHFESGPQEWIGTDAVFELSRDREYTVVLFSHLGWREQVEFMAHCSTKWASFMMSLKDYVETGKGRPAPHDVKIDNWN
ncbi:MAG TPA: SRPBCC domain-containing protein [Burkholderiaceae bacterium]|nr:SRPBCC domain-containing protein [Burkholderiaceae bacterium]